MSGLGAADVAVAVLAATVPTPAAGQTLVAWLAGRFSYFDAEGWRTAIAAGQVQCNGTAVPADTVLRAGDRVAFTPAAAPPAAASAQVAVLCDDADFVVVDKPPHLVAHHGGAFPQHTFVGALAARLGVAQLHFVHRLDRETSGLLLLAKSASATAVLQAQFQAGTVRKSYRAIVHGVLASEHGTLDAPIGRDDRSAVRVRRAVVPNGAPARTQFRVCERLPHHTVLELQPQTGRTHQLRVHLEHLGHPLVGDKLYGRTDAEYQAWVQHLKLGGDRALGGRLGADRQLLHAETLAFGHPRTGAAVVCRAPAPADFAAFVAAQRQAVLAAPSGSAPK